MRLISEPGYMRRVFPNPADAFWGEAKSVRGEGRLREAPEPANIWQGSPVFPPHVGPIVTCPAQAGRDIYERAWPKHTLFYSGFF